MTRTLTQKLKRAQRRQAGKVVYEPKITGPKPQAPLSKSVGERSAPVATTKLISGSKPKLGDRVFKVSHRELVNTFNNATTYQVNGGSTGNLYRVNPLNTALFSWLPAIAANFDRYRFTSLTFEYIPMCATSETGRVALYHDPDSQDPEPTDRVELANQWQLSETAPWCATQLVVPVDQAIRYTQDTNVVDTKLVDFGQFGVAVYSGPGTNVVGDVFVHYTVELIDPQPSSTMVQTIQIGTGAVNAGPNYAVVSNAAPTFFSLAFRVPGTYIVSMMIRGSAFSNFNGSTATINSNVVQTGVSAIAVLATVTALAPNQVLAINATAMGNYIIHVTRGKVANSSNLP